MSLRPEDIDRRSVAAYLRSRHAVHAQSNDQDDKTVFCIATEHVDYGDWVITNSNVEGHPNVSHAANDGDPEVLGVVQSHAQSNEWCRVAACGAVPAKVDPSESFSAGDWLALSSGNDYAVRWEDEDNRCGQFLYQLGDPSNGMAMVRIDSQGPAHLLIHHHTAEENSRWVDTSGGGTPLVGYSHHLFKVNKDAFTGGNDSLMLVLGGESSHGEAVKEGMAWGGVIGSNTSTGRGYLGGNESAGKQGPLGLEEDATDSQHSGAWRVNLRGFAGFNSRDRFGYAGGRVGSMLYVNPTEQLSYRTPGGCRTTTPTSPCAGAGVEWWGGAILWDDQATPVGNATTWQGQHVPALPIEIDCCTSYNNPEQPTEPDCEIVTGRSNFRDNALDLNGNYEWVIPYGWTATSGRQSVLHAICCLNTHIGALWTVLDRFTYWVGQYAACTDAFFATKADGVGAASTCCEDTPDFAIPAMNCGPTAQDVDCAGNPISG